MSPLTVDPQTLRTLAPGATPVDTPVEAATGSIADVTVTLYPAARHEILNETNRGEVTADIIAWLRAHST